MPHRILLVGHGDFYHVGAFFQRALNDLSLAHRFVDEGRFTAPRSRLLVNRVYQRVLGRHIGVRKLNEAILREAAEFRPTIVLTTMGRDVWPDVITQLRDQHHAVVVNFATDDPFNPRASTANAVASIPHFDVYVTTKRATVADIRKAGARHVIFVPFGYEPSLHFIEKPKSAEEAAAWSSDVAFLGGADADRVPFLLPLARAPGLELRLYGGYWDRAPELSSRWRGFARGRDYRLALGCARVIPGLVRRANRDGHVMRTFEAPACGAFMLAERTEEHLEMFKEGSEMAFFETPEELLDKTRYYLAHDAERRRLAEKAHWRVVNSGNTYRDRLLEILAELG